MPIAIILLLSLLGGGGAIVASRDSLPGDTLFSVKTFSEDARAFFVAGESKNEMHLEFAAERVREISEIARSSSESIENKRLSGLDDAINNLEDNLSSVADRASKMRDKEKALEIFEDLKANAGLLSEVMESHKQESSRQEVRNKIELALGKIDGVRIRVESEVNDIKETERSGPDNSQSSAGKIKAAENKLAEVERKFNRSGDDLLGDNKLEVEKKITEARDLIESAKDDSDNNKFDDAFEKAHQAIRAASLANALMSRDDQIRTLNNGVNQIIEDIRGRETELRGRANEPGEDIRGQESELRGRENEPGEDVRGQEAELRGREAEGEAPRGQDGAGDVSGQEIEIRGRDNKIEAPGDQPRQEDRGTESEIRGSDDSIRGSDGGSSSGRGGSDD